MPTRAYCSRGEYRTARWNCTQKLAKAGPGSAVNFEFKREWSQRGQMIVVRSELQSTVGNSVCAPNTITAVTEAMDEIRNSVNPVLRFERPTATKD